LLQKASMRSPVSDATLIKKTASELGMLPKWLHYGRIASSFLNLAAL
jgi:hypothetical protein